MSARSKRPFKPDLVLISDDEDEPTAKKNKEPVSSPENLDLQQKLSKMEEKYQGACRYARLFELQLEESKKRVDFLENILDKKPAVADAGANKAVDEQKKSESSPEINALKQEIFGLRRTIRSMGDAAPILQERVNSLTKQFEAEKQRASNEQARCRARIDELSKKLAQYEEGLQQLHKAIQQGSETTACTDNGGFVVKSKQLWPELTKLLLLVLKGEQKVEEPAKEIESAREISFKQEILALRRTIRSMGDAAPILQERVNTLTKQLEAERYRANEEHMKDRARIDELSKQLTQYEEGLQQLHKAMQQGSETTASKDNDATTSSATGLVVQSKQLCPELTKLLQKVDNGGDQKAKPPVRGIVNTLMKQLKAEQQRTRDEQTKYRVIIDDLSKQLVNYVNGLHQSPQIPATIQQPPLGSDTTASKTDKPEQLAAAPEAEPDVYPVHIYDNAFDNEFIIKRNPNKRRNH